MKSVICDTSASTKTEEKPISFEQNTFLVHFLRFRIVIKESRGQIYCMVGNLPLHGRQIESWVFIPPFLSAFPAKGQSNLIKENCNRIGTGRKRGRHLLNNLTPSFIQMALTSLTKISIFFFVSFFKFICRRKNVMSFCFCNLKQSLH